MLKMRGSFSSDRPPATYEPPDLKIIRQQDARDLLTDVANTHGEAATTALAPEKHQAVVEIVQRILAGKNGVRH